MSYRVKLDEFEGPLDLLLFFIKRDQLDIYDIPIAKIAKEFLDYIHFMQLLDLEVAGDFIVMAATLMQIKVKMLLPHEENVQELVEDDPRRELADRLAEYARFKEAAHNLAHLEEEGSKLYFRGFFKLDDRQPQDSEEEPLKNATLIDLITAFKRAMDRFESMPYHNIQRFSVTIEEQIEFVMNSIGSRRELHFLELVSSIHERLRFVVTFIALLELIKRNIIRVLTNGGFNDFIILKHEPQVTKDLMANPEEQSDGVER
jgi:segregation and condensation protein A